MSGRAAARCGLLRAWRAGARGRHPAAPEFSGRRGRRFPASGAASTCCSRSEAGAQHRAARRTRAGPACPGRPSAAGLRTGTLLPASQRPPPARGAVAAEGTGCGCSTGRHAKPPRAGGQPLRLTREVQGDRGAIDGRLARIAAEGDNWFGEQRFGQTVATQRAGDVCGPARASRPARAAAVGGALELFNRVLAVRVRDGGTGRWRAGPILDGSRSVFGLSRGARTATACGFRHHPSAPLWGRLRTAAAALALETSAARTVAGPRGGLEAAGLRQSGAPRASRRPGSRLAGPATRGCASGCPGSYATAVLAELGSVATARLAADCS